VSDELGMDDLAAPLPGPDDLANHPAVANARIVIEQEELERRLRDPERHAMRRFWKALMLATDVEAFEALLAGESVPVDPLDPEWMRRFGRRR
jgi:hypothetical protein